MVIGHDALFSKAFLSSFFLSAILHALLLILCTNRSLSFLPDKRNRRDVIISSGASYDPLVFAKLKCIMHVEEGTPQGRTHALATIIKDKILTLGGHFFKAVSGNAAYWVLNAPLSLSNVQPWLFGSEMAMPWISCAPVVVANDYAYVFGGLVQWENNIYDLFKNLYRFNADTAVFLSSSGPSARAYHASAATDTDLCVQERDGVLDYVVCVNVCIE